MPNVLDLFHVHKHIPGKYQIKNMKYKASWLNWPCNFADRDEFWKLLYIKGFHFIKLYKTGENRPLYSDFGIKKVEENLSWKMFGSERDRKAGFE